MVKVAKTKTLNQIQKDYLKKRNQASAYQFDTMIEKYVVKPSHSHFKTIDKLSHKANNLFNLATYECRQHIFNHDWLNYNQLNQLFKKKRDEHSNLSYQQLGTIQNAQQILKMVIGNFLNWSKARKAYLKHPNDFTGCPKLPHYHQKGQRSMLVISNQTAKLKNGYVVIKSLNDLKFKLSSNHIQKIQQVRIIPKADIFVVEIIYKIKQVIHYHHDNQRYLSLDPGVDNVFTMASNIDGLSPVIINGKALKSVNRYYNYQMSRLTKLHASNKQAVVSKRSQKLSRWRYLKMNRFAHEVSNYIVQYAVNHDVNTIIIGNNKNWKRSVEMGKRNNQNFVSIPHQQFIDKITYKAALHGIAVITSNEGYTSQTSFLDNERPCWENGNKSRKRNHLTPNNRRIHRGLFKSNHGKLINADVNGALQILRKVVPNAFANGIAGIGLCPDKYQVNF